MYVIRVFPAYCKPECLGNQSFSTEIGMLTILCSCTRSSTTRWHRHTRRHRRIRRQSPAETKHEKKNINKSSLDHQGGQMIRHGKLTA